MPRHADPDRVRRGAVEALAIGDGGDHCVARRSAAASRNARRAQHSGLRVRADADHQVCIKSDALMMACRGAVGQLSPNHALYHGVADRGARSGQRRVDCPGGTGRGDRLFPHHFDGHDLLVAEGAAESFIDDDSRFCSTTPMSIGRSIRCARRSARAARRGAIRVTRSSGRGPVSPVAPGLPPRPKVPLRGQIEEVWAAPDLRLGTGYGTQGSPGMSRHPCRRPADRAGGGEPISRGSGGRRAGQRPARFRIRAAGRPRLRPPVVRVHAALASTRPDLTYSTTGSNAGAASGVRRRNRQR